MPLTITDPIGQPISLGDRWMTIRQVDFDNSYPTGGESYTNAELGFSRDPDIIICLDKLGFSVEADQANEKLVVKCPGVVTTAAGAGTLDDFPLSGVGATAASIGLTAGNATTRFGGMVEPAATADLSTLTDVVVLSIGKYPA